MSDIPREKGKSILCFCISISKQLKLHLLTLKIKFSLKLRISHLSKPFLFPVTEIFPYNSVGEASQISPADLTAISPLTICSSGQGTDKVDRVSWAPGWGWENLRELNFHYSEIGQNLMESIHVAPSAVCDPANNFILKILSTKTSSSSGRLIIIIIIIVTLPPK